MEPSGSLFPSLVVVGHVVTLAAVWHWRRGRRRVQDEQGKAAGGYHLGCCHQLPPQAGGWGRGGQGAASLPPLYFPMPSPSCP